MKPPPKFECPIAACHRLGARSDGESFGKSPRCVMTLTEDESPRGRSPSGSPARVADDSEECRDSFHALVTEAIERAQNEHYEMKPHRSATDPKGRYDSAVIIFRE
jgi:hypothetical protein